MSKNEQRASDLEDVGVALSLVEPITGGILGGFGTILGKAFKAAERRKRTWWTHVVDNKTDEEFERTLEYELGQEHGEVILEGLRAALDAVDQAALAPLGRLTRLYLRTKSGKRDRFFRSCTRMFCDMDEVELRTMRSIVAWSLETVRREDFMLVQRAAHIFLVRDEHADKPESTAGIHEKLELDGSRTFELLDEFGVLNADIGNYFGGPPANIIATRRAFLKLRDVLTGVHEE